MNIKNNFKLIFSSFKLNIKKEWQYKASFFMQFLGMILNDLFFIIQWVIIFGIIDNIGGYGFNETMLLWSIGAGGYGFGKTFFNGAWNLKDMIYEGRMDIYLTQPKNVLINICCCSIDISAIGDIVYSFIVLFIVGAPWWWFLIWPFAIILVGLIFVSTYIVYCSLCFYVKNGEAMARTMEDALLKSQGYPPAIYSGIVKWILFSIIPAFFYAFIPAQYLFLSFNLWWVLCFIGVVALWVILAFVFFKLGLRKYNSGSLVGGRL